LNGKFLSNNGKLHDKRYCNEQNYHWQQQLTSQTCAFRRRNTFNLSTDLHFEKSVLPLNILSEFNRQHRRVSHKSSMRI